MVSYNNHVSYIEAIREQVSDVVVGQNDVVERLLIALFTKRSYSAPRRAGTCQDSISECAR